MSGHTPGPWKSGGCVVWQANGGGICDLAAGVADLHRSPAEVAANAVLIASAPELLAACTALLALVVEAREKLQRAHERARDPREVLFRTLETAGPVVVAAEDAIAKAGGTA
jgi:hypothetical protein